MATKRVNLTLNSDNYADSLIINLLGGWDNLNSKDIKAKLLQIAINNGSNILLTQKRNVLVSNSEQNSNKNETDKKLISDNIVTKSEHMSVEKVTENEQESNEFDLDSLITINELEKESKLDKCNDIDTLFNSMLKF